MAPKLTSSDEPGKDPPDRADESHPPAASGAMDADACLDALASALRIWGRLVFELPELSASEASALYEGWARHMLLGVDPPEGAAAAPGERNWADLARFLREHRSQEREFVLKSLEDMRAAVWVFVEAFAKSAAADRRGDAKVRTRLESLREAARSSDTGRLRKEAGEAANVVEGVINVRAARYETQIEQLYAQINHLSSELIETQRKSEFDDLTGAHSRGALDEYLLRVTQLGAVMGSHSILYLVDVDHFKWVNDRFGHQVGDEVLRQAVKRMGLILRRRDDFIGRYGGDEFAVIVQGENDEKASQNGERILRAIADVEVPHEGDTVRVNASVGAALLSPGDDPKSWIERADRALYEAKRAGRGRLVLDSPDPA